ncbi:MAG: hypothetical protein ACOC1K_02425 [Nanoarchaeota archaeon]
MKNKKMSQSGLEREGNVYKSENSNEMKEDKMAKFDWQDFILSSLAVFFGVMGITGVMTFISKGLENIMNIESFIIFTFSVIMLAVSIGILKEILD